MKARACFGPLASYLAVAAIAGCGSGTGNTVPGLYTVSQITCGPNGGSVPSNGAIADWINPPTEFTFNLVANGTSTEEFQNGSCQITLSFTTVAAPTGLMTFQGTGTYVCTGSCTAYATTLFGSNVCGTNNTSSVTYALTPPGGVASQELLVMTAQSPDTTCSTQGNTDPVAYTLVKD
jgi:hypothetical protein